MEMSQLSLNTVWVVTAAALVFFMQAGFAFLESGLVRSKNAVNVLMKNYIDMCFGALTFWAVGYGLMFGTNPTGWFGTDRFFLQGASGWDYTVLFYQMMFAATAATIVSGALAERIRYWAYVASAVVISTFIYAIYGSWAWGALDGQTSGWLKELGFIDFAGSSVVHALGGWCALAGVIVLGPRLGRYPSERQAASGRQAQDATSRSLPGHNLPMVALGGFILWLGWFGFNGGSTFEANAQIGPIVLNTHLAGAAGVVGALFALMMSQRPVLMTTTVNGGLAGLVAICAGANVIEPPFAIMTGLFAGALVVHAMAFLDHLRLDDAVGAVAVHGFAGAWGTIAVGLFNPASYFDLQQVGIQAVGAAAAFLWAFPTAWVMFKVINLVIGLRASSMDEQRGLDYTEHYEIGYPEFQQDLVHGGKA